MKNYVFILALYNIVKNGNNLNIEEEGVTMNYNTFEVWTIIDSLKYVRIFNNIKVFLLSEMKFQC